MGDDDDDDGWELVGGCIGAKCDDGILLVVNYYGFGLMLVLAWMDG